MTAVTAPCVRGCVIPEAHGPRCPCGAVDLGEPNRTHEHIEPRHDHDEHEDCDDDCRYCDLCTGCLPRPAARGLLCQADVGRATRALLGAGELVAWIRSNRTPGTWHPNRQDVLREAPAPLELAAVDDADELYSTMAAWAVRYCAETGLVGPGWLGSDVRPAAKRVKPGWHRDGCPETGCDGCWVEYLEARVVGLRSDASTTATVGGLADWLVAHLEGVAGRDWAGDFHDEVTRAYRAADARWPRAPREIKLPLPCPSCSRVLLFMHPPAEEGHPVTVVCHRDACGRVLSEGDYYLEAEAALYEHTGKTFRQRPA